MRVASLELLVAVIGSMAVYAVQAATRFDMDHVEQLPSTPDGWSMSRVPLPSTRIQLRIALHQRNVAKFDQVLLDMSTPTHPNYGKHMKRDELKALLRPTDAAISSVLGWLETIGIPDRDIVHDSDWIHLNLTVRQAEDMLDTHFLWYQDDMTGVERIRTLGYSVPRKLRKYIDMIQPTTRFGQMRAQRSPIFSSEQLGPANGQSRWKLDTSSSTFNYSTCNATVTRRVASVSVECLRHLYNIGEFQPTSVSSYGKNNAKFGICGYLEEYPRYDALATFLAEYAPYAIGANFTVTSVNGGLNTQNDTIDDSKEANLDIQYGLALAYPTPVEYYSTPGRGQLTPDLLEPIDANFNEPYLDFLHYILSLPDADLPQTLTTSYGEDEQSIPEPYTRATCNMFAQLGARGVSVIFSSGDSGVGTACQRNDGTNATRFLPVFPACCPFVTSVGATYGVLPEQAVFFSSGGFSERFPRPAYQDEAVSAYLNGLGTQWEGLYNPYGRAFPDVAAQGLHLHLIDQGKEYAISGTSASAPIFAAIIALINTARLEKSLPSLGFLNPWLYGLGKEGLGLTDIVHGGSTGCTANDTGTVLTAPTPFVPFASWNATKGWDPVTGLGTPNYLEMLQSALSTGLKTY